MTWARTGDRARLNLERELVETGRTRTQITAYRKDGRRVEVELISVAVRGDDDKITGYLGIHRDKTERKRAEEALREANTRSETILDRLIDSFSALDADWRFVYLNRRALDRIRRGGIAITLDDLVGKNIWAAFPHLVEPQTLAQAAPPHSTGPPWEGAGSTVTAETRSGRRRARLRRRRSTR